MIIGRMRVEAGSTPVWEGGDKNPYRRNMLSRLLNQGLGRNYIGNRPVNVSEMVEEEFRDDIKKQIEDKIILKFQKDTRYSEKAKQGIQSLLPNGWQMFSHFQESRIPSQLMVSWEDRRVGGLYEMLLFPPFTHSFCC